METHPALRPLRTEEDYKAPLREVSAYFDDEPAAKIAVGGVGSIADCFS